MAVNLDAIPLQFLDDGAQTPVTVVVTNALASALAKAATVNAGQDSFDLSFSSLLIGLVANDDAMGWWLRSYLQPVLPKMLARRHVTLEQFQALQTTDTPPGTVPLRRTVSARTALNEAERVHRDSDSGDTVPSIDTRHLVAALIGLPQYHEDDFRALGIDRPVWGKAFVPQVCALYPDETEFWTRWLAGTFPTSTTAETSTGAGTAGAPTGTSSATAAAQDRGLWNFAPDVYSQTDLLGIEREAHGLASLIASHKTTLPLSIGLFGHWGSGKTFFMRHIQSRVRTICQEAQKSTKPQAEIAFYRHVAQIEFNAWHYSEGELLPSLVEHILQNLKVDEQETPAQIEQRRALLLTQIQKEQQQNTKADAEIQTAQNRIAAQETALGLLRKKQNVERQKLATRLSALGTLDTVRAAITLDTAVASDAQSALNRMGVPVVHKSARDLQASLGHALTELSGASALLMPLLRAEGRGRRIVYLLLAIAAPMVAGAAAHSVLAAQGDVVATVSGWLVRGAGLLGAGSVWLQKQSAWVAARRQDIEKAKLAVDSAIERQTTELQANQAQALNESLQELERLRAEHSALARARDERARQIQALDLSLARTSSTYLLNQFILERKDASDYRKLLGFMALIRRDFDKLSELIDRSNKAILKGETIKSDNDPRLNRIVLYIDDLDRCPEDQVVKVLRAVHLLLAFPLFVVVVAVDSRWLTRCLRTQHQAIFGPVNEDPNDPDPASATPLDYLEKIFQIPLWLQPLNERQRTDLVTTLLKEGQPLTTPGAGSGARSTSKAPAPIASAEPAQGVAGAEPQTGAAQNPVTPVEPIAATGGGSDTHAPFDLNPTGLTISPDEWEFVETLATLPLSQTPRVLKRFANTYRLIKSSLSQKELHGFLEGGTMAPFSICLFQLAVLTSDPAFAPHYLKTVRTASRSYSTVLDWVKALSKALKPEQDALGPPTWYDAQYAAEWTQHHAFFQLTRLHHSWSTLSTDDYAWWAMRAARFTFVQE